MKQLNSKGQVQGVTPLILGIVGAVIVLAVGFMVIAELRSAAANCESGFSYNSTSNLCQNQWGNVTANTSTPAGTLSATTIIDKLGLVPNFIGIIIIVALASIVLGFFFLRGRR